MADATADLEIRLLRPDDDPDAQLDLAERAFGPGSGADRDRRARSLSRLVAGRRRGAGRRLCRHALHARRLLTDTPSALRPSPPAAR
jgi:hypothetical protein